MRKCNYLLLLTVWLTCILYSRSSFAQNAPADSSSQQNAFNNALALYYGSIGDQSPLYNGPEYYFYDPLIKGTAYFLDIRSFTPGSVYYDGALYTGVPMIYDLFSDKVAVLLYNHFSKFSLLSERVKSFDFLDHHFVNIKVDTIDNKGGLKTGFYDELYNAKTQVLVRREKDIQINTSGSTGPQSYFNAKISYFFRKKNAYYSISSQGALIDILKDKKKATAAIYLGANKIKV